MKFIDEAKIWVKSGNGGNGCLSFRREAHIPYGGPDGGNGGRGGHIIFKATSSINTLIDYRFKKHFKAQNGEAGKGKNRFGKNGSDLTLMVPVGTQILSESGNIIADLDQHGQELLFLEGGKGGAGNAAFKSSKNQTPKYFKAGIEGENLNIILQLKIISDMGIIGFPNAGKSTLLSTISRAKPKIANYPFTTLKPELGVIFVDNHEFVMADIPGLIEGASLGIGLGHKFLKHIERCKALLHLIDITANDIYISYKTIRKELEQYSKILLKKQEIVALNKTDLISAEEIIEKQTYLSQKIQKPVLIISAATQNNLDNLKRSAYQIIAPKI
ncbi:MAG: Obg family GTPase CgtA [Rickettsiales bacterium]